MKLPFNIKWCTREK